MHLNLCDAVFLDSTSTVSFRIDCWCVSDNLCSAVGLIVKADANELCSFGTLSPSAVKLARRQTEHNKSQKTNPYILGSPLQPGPGVLQIYSKYIANIAIVVPYIDQYWQILTKYWQKMTKTVKNVSFSKGACLQKKKNTAAASLKRRNNGLGLPIHIKKILIVLDIRCYIILHIY